MGSGVAAADRRGGERRARGCSQFSREFKRLFGVTRVEEAEQTRARLAPVDRL